jgi:hypothetical protein
VGEDAIGMFLPDVLKNACRFRNVEVDGSGYFINAVGMI